MTYQVRCPNCGHAAPWELRDVPIEVWCANCCSYDATARTVQWIYNFTVLPNPRCHPKKRIDEDRLVYGGWYLGRAA